MLTDQEKSYIKAAFDVAMKQSPDTGDVADVLNPLRRKIEAIANELRDLKAKECQH